MNTKIITSMALIATTAAHGGGLYNIPNDTESNIPIKWTAGLDLILDDNTTPGASEEFNGDETFSVNPYLGLSFVNITPQTTLDVFARLGVIYYLDEPEALGADNTYGQARVGVNLTHRFDERLRFTTNNFLSYELEPDYSYGFASNRQIGEYLYWQTDNSVGYRWTQRFATYTGLQTTDLSYDSVEGADTSIWTVYNQLRFQHSSRSVLTASYRYSETDSEGNAADSTNQFLLAGIEHRFSPNTILILNTGAQLRDVQGLNGDDSTNPYLELALRSQVNTQLGIRGFIRYSVEDYDTAVALARYDERLTLRLGVSGDYQLSPSLSFFSGVNLITTSYESGNFFSGGAAPVLDEVLVNAYLGASLKFTDYLYGTLTYNLTTTDSDIANREYDRNRVSVGLRAEF